jgi:hypothetical protein
MSLASLRLHSPWRTTNIKHQRGSALSSGHRARGALTARAVFVKSPRMASIGFTYWREEEMWLGYLDQYPDYMTQGTSLDDLKEHLLDLYNDLSSGVIPSVRQHSELELV